MHADVSAAERGAAAEDEADSRPGRLRLLRLRGNAERQEGRQERADGEKDTFSFHATPKDTREEG